MKNTVSFQWGKEHLEVDIHAPADRRSRILIGLEATVLLGFWTGLLLRRALLPETLFIVLLLAVGGLTAALAIRAAARFTHSEKIFVDATHITLIQSTCFRKTVRSYDLAGIGPLRYHFPENEAVAPTCRPGDLFCDGHSAQLRRALAHSGNLFFTYGSKRVYFGKGVYSWHAEEMAFYLRLYCGNALQFGPEWEAIREDAEH